MRKRFVIAMLAIFLTVCGLNVQAASAISPNLVISQIQLGDAVSASDEFIEIYNNSSTDTDITDWCLYYASASSTQVGNKLGCFVSSGDSFHLYLPSHAYAFAISTASRVNQPNIGSDITFSAGLSGTAGHVRIIDSQALEIDKIGWGLIATSPETMFAPVPTLGSVLQRKLVSTDQSLQDTDNNSTDFKIDSPKQSYSYGVIYEVKDLCKNISGVQATIPEGHIVDTGDNCALPPADVCTNIDGLQTTTLEGYEMDDDGLCQPDLCHNIVGLQVGIPNGQTQDNEGNCFEDYCLNLDDIQSNIPDGYYVNSDGDCLLDLRPLRLNELLPNPEGSDKDNEFIEMYNPYNVAVSLAGYQLKIGIDSPKVYSFPDGAMVEAGDYITFSNLDIGYTLINSGGVVSLISEDNQIIDTIPTYVDAIDGMSWALLDGVWQYTNRPTPGSQNMPSTIQPVIETTIVASNLKPCAPNQYRSLDTNRCRMVITTDSTMAPCKDGQYRSEITNRCRSIASDANTPSPCASNQERNPDTNRCHLIASSNISPVDCKSGQERNPTTNRCRNVASTSIPTAGFSVEPIADSPTISIGWWIAGGIIIVAIGYGIWEWREEVVSFVRWTRTFTSAHK